MNKQTRRDFISVGTAAVTGAGLGTFAANDNNMIGKDKFIHHVYFWLKDPSNKESFDKLIQGLKKLSAVKTIKMFHIGKPAGTSREVIENSYSVSWLLVFNNRADQDSYQVDPIHLKFIEECKELWSKVVVYDSVDV